MATLSYVMETHARFSSRRFASILCLAFTPITSPCYFTTLILQNHEKNNASSSGRLHRGGFGLRGGLPPVRQSDVRPLLQRHGVGERQGLLAGRIHGHPDDR